MAITDKQFNDMQDQINMLIKAVNALADPSTIQKQNVKAILKRIYKISPKSVASVTQYTGTTGGLPVPKLPDAFRKLADNENIAIYYD